MSPLRSFGSTVAICDASVLANALGDDSSTGHRVRVRLLDESVAAPDLIYLETASVWRRQVRLGSLTLARAHEALADLSAYPIREYAHRELVEGCWRLRDVVSIYDAAYIVLAAALEQPLLTADAKLARAARSLCQVELLQ